MVADVNGDVITTNGDVTNGEHTGTESDDEEHAPKGKQPQPIPKMFNS